jgi:hypothetical protein
MSRIIPFPASASRRAAILDLVGSAGARPSSEEAEFIAALRRIVAGTPLEEMQDRYHLSSRNRTRVFARYTD